MRLLRDSCEQVAKRLNLHTATNKQHIKCCDTCLQCKDGLIFDGGTLRHEGICVEEKHHSVWLVQHLVNSASCGNTVNEIAHTLSFSTVVEAYVLRNVACGHPCLVCGPALLIWASDRVVGSTCCRLLRVEFTVTRTSGTKVFCCLLSQAYQRSIDAGFPRTSRSVRPTIDPSRICPPKSMTLGILLLLPCRRDPDTLPDALGHVKTEASLHFSLCRSRGTDTFPPSTDPSFSQTGG